MTEAIWSIIGAGGLLIVSQLSPGPDFFLVVRTALSQGFRRASALALGITLGLLIQVVVVGYAGTWLAKQSWSCLVMAAGGAWLIYLAYHIMPASVWKSLGRLLSHGRGWQAHECAEGASEPESGSHGGDTSLEQTLETSSSSPEAPRAPLVSHRSLLLQGFLCNILNPKCMLFIAAICIGPLNAYSADCSWFMPALAVAMAAASQGGWMLWSAVLQYPPLRRSYCRRAHVVDAVFATLLAFCGLLLFVPVAETAAHLFF